MKLNQSYLWISLVLLSACGVKAERAAATSKVQNAQVAQTAIPTPTPTPLVEVKTLQAGSETLAIYTGDIANITSMQKPVGKGRILLTDTKYLQDRDQAIVKDTQTKEYDSPIDIFWDDNLGENGGYISVVSEEIAQMILNPILKKEDLILANPPVKNCIHYHVITSPFSPSAPQDIYCDVANGKFSFSEDKPYEHPLVNVLSNPEIMKTYSCVEEETIRSTSHVSNTRVATSIQARVKLRKNETISMNFSI